MNMHLISGNRTRDKRIVVAILEENRMSVIAPQNYVVNPAWEMNSRSTRHPCKTFQPSMARSLRIATEGAIPHSSCDR